MKLRWKKEPRETGLSAVGRDSAKRPSRLHDGNGNDFAFVYAHDYCTWTRGKSGWYWTVHGEGIPYRNTCNETPLCEADAKAEAAAYVKSHLKATS